MVMASSQSIQTQSVEKNLHKRGFRFIIGSDEAGRGCIAGPVVVASCCLLTTTATTTTGTRIDGVDDSKNLSESERLRIFRELQASPHLYAWTVAQASNLDIEQSNILRATMTAFSKSIETLVETYDLPCNSTYSIVDGKKSPKLAIPVPCRPWVRGDAQVYTVACASVIAKVTRDALMKEAGELFPHYGFDVNKGYPTRDHIQAIHTHGPCPLHRMSFKPLKGR
jgi:ribonuclease HII